MRRDIKASAGAGTGRIAGISLPAACGMLFAALISACDTGRSAFTREQFRAAATALHQQQLYREAIEVYEDYLRSPVIPPEDVPKVIYQMGAIYQEDLMDPRSAFAKFALVKALYPGETFNNQLGKRMVACLESMGRSVDASAARSRITDIRPDSSAPGVASFPGGSTVVAEMDGRKITLGEIASLVGKLPESPLEVNQLVREYVAQILIAEAARRKGLADRPEVRLRIGQFENQILAQEGLKDEIRIPEPTGNDLRYYFEANKARYSQGAGADSAGDSTGAAPAVAFEAVAQRVQADWAREKQAAQYQAYVERLLQTAQVRFHSATAGTQAKGAPAP